MKRVPFTYCVIRYSPDPGAGEMLNIGVVLHCGATREVHYRFDEHYERLSAAFAGFDGRNYRRNIARLKATIRRAIEPSAPLLTEPAQYNSAKDCLRAAIGDEGLSLRIGEQLGGITSDVPKELHILFERMVTSRRAPRPENDRLTDEQVWETVLEPELPEDVKAQIRPTIFRAPDLEIQVDYAFKNGRWHVVQPVSLDAKQANTIRRRASEWAGMTLGLQAADDTAKVYFVLGAPRDSRLQKAYDRAKRLLDKAPIDHELIEEEDGPVFAKRLTELVRHNDAD